MAYTKSSKKAPWIILLIVGLLPFLIAFGTAIYAAVTGYTGLMIMGTPQYGWTAMIDWLILWSYVYWPTYLVGLICIIISLIKLNK